MADGPVRPLCLKGARVYSCSAKGELHGPGLLGYVQSASGTMRPVHEPPPAPKPTAPVSYKPTALVSRKPMAPVSRKPASFTKTVLIKEDPNGKKYICVNNQCVPLMKVRGGGSQAGGSSPARPDPARSKMLYMESKVVKLNEEMRDKINAEVQTRRLELARAQVAANRLKRQQYRATVNRNRNGLLDIIQSLRAEYKAVKHVLGTTRRALAEHKVMSERAAAEATEVREQLESVTSKMRLYERKLKPSVVKSAKTQTEVMAGSAETQTDDLPVPDARIDDSLSEYGQGNTLPADFNLSDIDIEATPIDFQFINDSERGSSLDGMEPVLLRNVDMGCNLPKPVINRCQPINGNGINGNIDQLKLLVWMCYQMCNIKDTNGDYPIHTAVISNNLKAVQRQSIVLKTKGISIDIMNDEGYTPLHLAVANEVSPLIVSELQRYGADFGEVDSTGNNVYHLGATYGTLKELEKSVQFFAPESINAFNYQGFTPLMLAIINRNIGDAELLIVLGADLNLQDKKSGRTALFHAIESNSLDLVNLLLTRGADRSVTNFLGMAVHEAIIEMDVSSALRMIFNQADEEQEPELPPPKQRKRAAQQKGSGPGAKAPRRAQEK